MLAIEHIVLIAWNEANRARSRPLDLITEYVSKPPPPAVGPALLRQAFVNVPLGIEQDMRHAAVTCKRNTAGDVEITHVFKWRETDFEVPLGQLPLGVVSVIGRKIHQVYLQRIM